MISAMGRKLLVAENPSVHQILSSSLLVASMVVVVALVSSLCIFWRKTETPPDDSQEKTTENIEVISPSRPPNEEVAAATPAAETITEPPAAMVVELESGCDKTEDAAQPQPDQEEQPLPPPPGVRHLRGAGAASCQIRRSTSSSASSTTSKLLSSMSVRLQGGAKGLIQHSRREEMQDKIRDKIKLRHEDSVWKKTIILGEKCRVPDEEDDPVVYDNKGNRISTYHPRTLSALPAAFGETSSADPCEIPSCSEQK